MLQPLRHESKLPGWALRDGISARSPQLLERALKSTQENYQPKLDSWLVDLKRKSAEVSSFLEQSNDTQTKIAEEHEQHWTEIKTRINEGMNAAIKSIQETEASYKQQMELQAPVDYWTAKVSKHAAATQSAQNVLVQFVIWGGTSLLLFLIGLSLLAGTMASGDPVLYLKFVAVGAVAVTIAFWIARVLLRIFLSERHLATDAEERVTMVKTYLALANETKVESADRALVLGPLFRSAADGIVRDEGPDASLAGVIARALDIKSKG